MPLPRPAASRDYLSIKLDDPTFPDPIHATLEVEGDDGYKFIWSRPSGLKSRPIGPPHRRGQIAETDSFHNNAENAVFASVESRVGTDIQGISMPRNVGSYSTSDLSRKSGDIIAEALRHPVTITQRNKPRLVLLNIDDYERLMRQSDACSVGTLETMPRELFDEFEPAVNAYARTDEAGR